MSGTPFVQSSCAALAFPFIGKDWPGWKTYSEASDRIADLLNRFNINTSARPVKLLRTKISLRRAQLSQIGKCVVHSFFGFCRVNKLDSSFRG